MNEPWQSKFGNTPGSYLLVRENLASGREVVFVYDRMGRLLHAWDTASLPSKWMNHALWHPSGVAIGKIPDRNSPNKKSKELPDLFPAKEEELEAWLAATYSYISPLMGSLSVPLSSFGLFNKEIISALNALPETNSMLEIGGGLLRDFLHPGKTGFVLSPVDDQVTNSQFSTGVKYIQGTAENIPFSDGDIDSVICLFVLEHTINPIKILKEINRVLVQGGLLVLGIPVDQNPHGEPPLFHRWRFVINYEPGHHRTIDLESLVIDGLGYTRDSGDMLSPDFQEGDACLFILKKNGQGAHDH